MFSKTDEFWVANCPGCSVTAAEALVIANLGSVTASAAEINTAADGIAATAIEVNNKFDGSASYVLATTVTAVEVIKATDTGRIFLIGNTIASTMALILPAEAAGLNYKFVYVGNAAEGSNVTITSQAAANYFIGGVIFEDEDGESITPVYADGNSNSLVTLVTPAAGTEIEILCNGTGWYIWGRVVSATICTIADT